MYQLAHLFYDSVDFQDPNSRQGDIFNLWNPRSPIPVFQSCEPIKRTPQSLAKCFQGEKSLYLFLFPLHANPGPLALNYQALKYPINDFCIFPMSSKWPSLVWLVKLSSLPLSGAQSIFTNYICIDLSESVFKSVVVNSNGYGRQLSK